jgi:hypothetical protein
MSSLLVLRFTYKYFYVRIFMELVNFIYKFSHIVCLFLFVWLSDFHIKF